MQAYIQLAVLGLSLLMLLTENWLKNSPERKAHHEDDINQAFGKAVVDHDTDTISVMLDERLRGVL